MTFAGLTLSPMLGTFNAFIARWHSSKQIIEQTLWKDLNKLRSWCHGLMILYHVLYFFNFVFCIDVLFQAHLFMSFFYPILY